MGKRIRGLVCLASLSLLLVALAQCGQPAVEVPPPPETKVEVVTDTLHGVEIADPYRWLEDQESPETRAWIDEQNAYTDKIMAQLPGQEELKAKITKLMNVNEMSIPRERGGRVFYSRRDAGQDLWVSYWREGFDGEVTWVQDASGVETRSDPIWPKMAWLMEPQGALRLEDYFAGLEVTARENVDGRVLYVLEPDGLDRAHYALYFDAETGLLVRIGYYWELKDYREVDGLYLPLRIDMSRKGGSSTLILDSVKHNLPLHDGLFAVPAEAAPPGE